MGASTAASAERVISFGAFRLLPAQQLLLEGETPVHLGSRALEILIALVERPGELVSKAALMARVWPNTVVEESNLKVHVGALRKGLGDGRPGHRYVVTVPGRGYRFVARVEFSDPADSTVKHTNNLPASPTRLIGRGDVIDALKQQLPQTRFITCVGPAGIGKTTVAIALAEALAASYEHGVWFVDLAPLSDAHFVPGALASALALTLHSENAVAALVACVRKKRMMIVLDSCEHLIEATASLAEALITGAPDVHILATSREPLRARGERVHRLSPLQSPPSSCGLTAADALNYPAVELFVERASASLEGFQLTDADAPVVADICRKLEGTALAIELAATRINAFGVRELSALLEDRLRLLNHGKSVSRHRSLVAALDWSYDFLPRDERVILRELSVFAGAFTLESATAMATGAGLGTPQIIDAVANLVAKSLVSADVSGAVTHYRLLDTTRAYARQKLAESGELHAAARHHALHHLELLERSEAQSETRPASLWLAEYARKIDDVRSALNWAFAADGDASIGVALTVAAIPLWMHLSLLDECRVCVERALTRDTSPVHAMKLSAALGAALLYTRGPLPETEAAWTRGLVIAERLSEKEYQLRTLWGLAIYRVYVGEYRTALDLLKTFSDVASQQGELAHQLSGHRLAATALCYLGDLDNARRTLDRVLSEYTTPVHRSRITRFQFDQRVAARGTLSNLLWLQGFPDQAIRTARSAVEDAQATDHPLSLCSALGHAAFPIALYIGDLTEAERLLAMLLDHLAKHALTVWDALGVCLQGMLLTKRGESSGLSLLRDALKELREAGFRLRYSSYLGTLAHALGLAGEVEQSHTAIQEALEWSERSEERWFSAELLRIKGELLRLDGSAPSVDAAADCYRQAIDLARRQGALAWELRSATSLAQLSHQRGKTEEAKELLSAVYGRFTEGFETADLKVARALMDGFGTALADRAVAGAPPSISNELSAVKPL